jgi:replicative DNA helicase
MLANLGIERAVISSLCKYGKLALIEIEDVGINNNSFTEINNQAIFHSVKYALQSVETIDQAVLLTSLKDLGYSALFDTKKDIEYLASLFNFPIKEDNIRNFAIRLEKITIARIAIQKHKEAIESLEKITGSEDIENIIQVSENPIFDLLLELNRNKDKGPQLLFDDIEELLNFFQNNPNDTIGVPTPWATYNAAIGGGLRRGGVNLIAARPKVGKTTLAKEALLHFTTNLKIPTLMLDTEMVKADQQIRTLASMANVKLKDIETGAFAKNHFDLENLHNVIKIQKKNKKAWYASVFGKPFEEILATIRRWVIKEVGYDENGNVNDCVVLYDYFKLMDRNQLDKIQEYQAMGFQISRLTDFCKEFDFACLAFVQLNRQGDISQSDRLRWLCHSYATFTPKEPQEQLDDGGIAGGNRKVTIMDTRFGPGVSDGDYICLQFNKDHNNIKEISLKSELGKKEEDIQGFQINDDEHKEQEPNEDEQTPWE